MKGSTVVAIILAFTLWYLLAITSFPYELFGIQDRFLPPHMAKVLESVTIALITILGAYLLSNRMDK